MFVALGFAALENFLYVMTSDISTGLVRAVTAIPGHASDAIIMGYFLGYIYSIKKIKKISSIEGELTR